jgi:hypothetical protein
VADALPRFAAARPVSDIQVDQVMHEIFRRRHRNQRSPRVIENQDKTPTEQNAEGAPGGRPFGELRRGPASKRLAQRAVDQPQPVLLPQEEQV